MGLILGSYRFLNKNKPTAIESINVTDHWGSRSNLTIMRDDPHPDGERQNGMRPLELAGRRVVGQEGGGTEETQN